jgi:hypothetical protein
MQRMAAQSGQVCIRLCAWDHERSHVTMRITPPKNSEHAESRATSSGAECPPQPVVDGPEVEVDLHQPTGCPALFWHPGGALKTQGRTRFVRLSSAADVVDPKEAGADLLSRTC